VGRFIARQGATDLSATAFELWCKAEQHLSPNTRYARQLLVRKLCLFRRRQLQAVSIRSAKHWTVYAHSILHSRIHGSFRSFFAMPQHEQSLGSIDMRIEFLGIPPTPTPNHSKAFQLHH